jgi:methionyl aminopeptidase
MPKIAHDISIKSDKEIALMQEGGAKLKEIKNKLKKSIKQGAKASEIEKKATQLIKKAGGAPSFKMVPGYHWSTCINTNAGLVHGIPKDVLVFKKHDVVSVDVGIYYKGFHTDTSFTVAIKPDRKIKKFLGIGRDALAKSIKKAQPGKRIYDISKAIEDTVKKGGYSPIKALVGHGVGKNLHEEPQIPCFVYGRRIDTLELKEGMVLAIEVMYTMGDPDVELDQDGWTISMADGKISALFEDTVAVTKKEAKLLT